MASWRFTSVMMVFAACGLIVGCAATGGAPKALPAWVLSPPDDTGQHIYGVGEGASLRQARDDALAAISGKLETRVSSDVQMETVLKDGEERSTTRNRIRTTTEALKLSDFQTVQNAESSNGRFVLLAVDRESLVSSMRSELAAIDSAVSGRLDGSKDESLKRLYRLTMSLPLIHDAISKSMLLQTVSRHRGDGQDELVRYQRLLGEREALQQNLRLGVLWDKDTAGVGDAVLGSLLKLGVHAEPWAHGRQYDGRIAIISKRTDTEIFNEYHVQLKVTAELTGHTGDRISSAMFAAAASSLASYEAATISVNRQLARQVRQQGVWHSLNMHQSP